VSVRVRVRGNNLAQVNLRYHMPPHDVELRSTRVLVLPRVAVCCSVLQLLLLAPREDPARIDALFVTQRREHVLSVYGTVVFP